MSGAAAKKAAKASAAAKKKYQLLMCVANGLYGLRWLLGSVKLGWFGIFRWITCFACQYVAAMFLYDAAAQDAGATEKDAPPSGSHFFDAFIVITACQVLAAAEYSWRGAEAIWWVAAVVPVGGAWVAYTTYKGFTGSGLGAILGLGGRPTAEPDPEMEAKRKRRQDLKMKRAAVGARN
jgi:hypothetical protein